MAESRRRQNVRRSRCPNCHQRGHFASECTASVSQFSSSTTFASIFSASSAQTTSSFPSSSTSVSSISVPSPISKWHELNESPESLYLPNEMSTVSKEPPSKKLDTEDEPLLDGKSFHYAGQSFHWDPTSVDTVYDNPAADDVEPSESPIAAVASPHIFTKDYNAYIQTLSPAGMSCEHQRCQAIYECKICHGICHYESKCRLLPSCKPFWWCMRPGIMFNCITIQFHTDSAAFRY